VLASKFSSSCIISTFTLWFFTVTHVADNNQQANSTYISKITVSFKSFNSVWNSWNVNVLHVRRLGTCCILNPNSRVLGKGKAIAFQAWTNPWDSRRLRHPEFLDDQHMKVKRLSAVPPAAFTPRRHPVTHFCYRLNYVLNKPIIFYVYWFQVIFWSKVTSFSVILKKLDSNKQMPIPFSVRSQAWVWIPTFIETACSNPAGDMDICLLWMSWADR
jgi:hypothetical protein